MEQATPPNAHIRVLEVEISAPMTSGQSYYFKVGGIPIRAAWIKRRCIGEAKTRKYTAVLFVLVEAEVSSELDVCGPYIIPLTPLISMDRTLDIVTLDSGVVEAYQNLAWRYELTKQKNDTSLIWFNESPDMLKAWFKHAGFGKHLGVKIICCGASSKHLDGNEEIRKTIKSATVNGPVPIRKDGQGQGLVDGLAEALRSKTILLYNGSIDDALQDFILGSKNLYVVGENLRSYGVRPKRLDFDDGKVYKSLDV
ncbi:hypothetical protein CH63R_14482 [Colletotrichum higginsianum IMI 349063]|uniref:Uncharacterized protein n=1 Tax=Colletotrichum higginsianum (strain IMI 349063) TaxID=759273 RepID=A0A1B7XR01_COLHI|nr:hypothetical protein CH63R_14482 [Colletotrichum higginsianum IMI 349063]OBR02181.1 hypothetical protein CH63R_14482 [Colletotrichum higginsianum IMI 349063]